MRRIIMTPVLMFLLSGCQTSATSTTTTTPSTSTHPVLKTAGTTALSALAGLITITTHVKINIKL